MSNNKNINIHPSLTPRTYLLLPYRFYKKNKKKNDREVEENDSITKLIPLHVKSFHDIKIKLPEVLHLSHPVRFTFDPIGEEDFDEGYCFGNSIVVTVENDDYSFEISFDCYATINAYQWGENAHWGSY